MGRWIKLHSSIKESAVWSDPLRFKAWVSILIEANYKDKEIFFNGQPLKIKRGQFLTSVRHLAEDWNCSPRTVRRILKQFEEMNMISVSIVSHRATLLTVVKYGVFQDERNSEGHSKGYSEGHTEEHSEGHSDGTQHKNIKNNKNSKEYNTPSSPDGGPAPEDWTDQDEDDFIQTRRTQPELSRIEFKEAMMEMGIWH